jgi:hypothetical protein
MKETFPVITVPPAPYLNVMWESLNFFASLKSPVGGLAAVNWEALVPHVQLKDVICFV